MDHLKERSPGVIALWNLESKIAKEVFGEKSVFYEIPEERDLELQRLGEGLLAELRSGRFDKGFRDYWAGPRAGKAGSAASGAQTAKPCSPHPMETLLSNYRGPVESREPLPRLMNANELHFLSFELPEYPPLARMAKIPSEVVLSVTVNEDTGEVKNATSVSGHPLLVKRALGAARRWRFDPKTQDTSRPIRVVLEYAFNCP
ncbi:MAG: energy transducer TonB [Acidobacteriia bacterium]|nr:energy transducer TonB [Terriglobia bacterium]